MHYNRTPTWAIYAVLVALSCGVYSNTLLASFAFDDNFAVVRQFAALAMYQLGFVLPAEVFLRKRLKPNVTANTLNKAKDNSTVHLTLGAW